MTRPLRDARAADRRAQRHGVRHPQSLPVQQRPPDGRARRGTSAPSPRSRQRELDGDHAAHAALRDCAHRGVSAAGHQRGDQPWPAGGRRRRSITCTCTWCRGGRATRTSCPSWATCGCCPRKWGRARSGYARCSRDSVATRSRRCILAPMHLELTPAQEAFRAEVEAFARERVAPKAAEIDESNAFPCHWSGRRLRAGCSGSPSRASMAVWGTITWRTRWRSRPSHAPVRPSPSS